MGIFLAENAASKGSDSSLIARKKNTHTSCSLRVPLLLQLHLHDLPAPPAELLRLIKIFPCHSFGVLLMQAYGAHPLTAGRTKTREYGTFSSWHDQILQALSTKLQANFNALANSGTHCLPRPYPHRQLS